MNKKNILLYTLILFYFKLAVCEIFPTPEILKDNVIFWKKIYAEVSLKEGLLHDSDYPLVIYKKISVNTQARRRRNRIINKEKDRIEALLETITTQPESSWTTQVKKIAVLFKKNAPKSALKGAVDRIRFQRGQKERFRDGLYRSGAYIDTIKAILAQYNIPERLAYLPHVESSFSPHAYSRVGAAGMWQFMRRTGRIYLKINYTIDERRDPILSTFAAAKLLSHNYSKLKSWPLAITAYNHGLGGMKRAVAQTGSRDIAIIIQKHKSRIFKFASKNFYSCFLAASEIARNPRKYFPNISFAPPLKYQVITLEYYIRPNVLAKYIGISKKELQNLNLAIRPIVFKQNKLIPKGTNIHIPLSISIADARLALGSLPDSLKIKTPPRPKYYRVRRGDNLYTIARRLGVSAKGLALENNISRMNRIYAGQILRLPGIISSSEKTPIITVAKAEKKIVIQPTDKQPAVKTTKKQQPLPEEMPDSLKDILMATAESIPESKALIKPIHSYKFDADIYKLNIDFSPEENSAVIRISIDETIGHYADWLDIPTQRIREINYMGRRSTIRINQELTIPVDKESVEQFNRRRLEYHMALEEDFYSQYKLIELKSKVIQRGENLWDICNADGIIPLWLLTKYNKHIDIVQLFPKMQIWLPVVEEKTESDLKQEANTEWRGMYPGYQEPFFTAKPFQLIP